MFYHQKLDKTLELPEIRPYWSSRDLADRLQISRSTIQRCLNICYAPAFIGESECVYLEDFNSCITDKAQPQRLKYCHKLGIQMITAKG
jgi:DeoR/GlpR family transcriptional regulator of sugar metabolism